MSSVTQRLSAARRIVTPSWLSGAVAYETIMGSAAYGVSSDTSDLDVYGFCVPPKEQVFPHLAGEIPGFGQPAPRLEQFQEHHIADPDARGGQGQQYDVTIFSIVKFFQLAMENSPNVIDSLFTPRSCVLHATAIGERVREQRRIFLHRGAWHKFKGYSYKQMRDIGKKPVRAESDSAGGSEDANADCKLAYHVVRLLDVVAQILTTGDLDLQRDRERLKAIRRGEWTADQVRDFFTRKERELESAYAESALPHGPDEPRIRQLLLDCLEAHYGSLEGAIETPGQERDLLRQIKALCERAGV